MRAGILDEPTGQVDPIAEIRRDPSITEEQKKTLVRIYQSFRRENELDDGAGSGPDGGSDGGSDEPDPDGSSDPSDVTVAS